MLVRWIWMRLEHHKRCNLKHDVKETLPNLAPTRPRAYRHSDVFLARRPLPPHRVEGQDLVPLPEIRGNHREAIYHTICTNDIIFCCFSWCLNLPKLNWELFWIAALQKPHTERRIARGRRILCTSGLSGRATGRPTPNTLSPVPGTRRLVLYHI